MGKVEQTLVADIAEGAAQQGRQGQVVAGEEDEADQGPQVLKQDVIGQLQPVGPANRDALALQLQQDLVEQGPATPHEDDEVAPVGGPDRLFALLPNSLPRVDNPADLRGDPRSEDPGRGIDGQGVWRIGPGFPLLLLRPGDQVPEVDAAPMLAPCLVADVSVPSPQEGLAALGGVEDVVHEAQDVPCRSPGHLQLNALEDGPHRLGTAAIGLEFGFHPVRRGALEVRIDHWAGEVSWASSTSTCASFWSSL